MRINWLFSAVLFWPRVLRGVDVLSRRSKKATHWICPEGLGGQPAGACVLDSTACCNYSDDDQVGVDVDRGSDHISKRVWLSGAAARHNLPPLITRTLPSGAGGQPCQIDVAMRSQVHNGVVRLYLLSLPHVSSSRVNDLPTLQGGNAVIMLTPHTLLAAAENVAVICCDGATAATRLWTKHPR